MKGSVEEFLECLHFPRIESNNFETHVHFIDEISDEQFHLLMDSDKLVDSAEENEAEKKIIN